MTRLPDWIRLPRGVRWTPFSGVAVAGASVLAGLGLWAIGSLLWASLTFGGSLDPASALKAAAERHQRMSEVERRRFDGRSGFFMPTAPVRRPPPKPAEPPKPPPPPKPVGPPATYSGPQPVAAIGDTILFANGSRVRIGQEDGGVRVIASDAPWSVKLGYLGGEYEVPLWDRGSDSFFGESWGSRKAVPGIEPVADATPKPPAPVQPPLPPGSRPAEETAGTPSTESSAVTAPPSLEPERIATMTQAEVQAAMQAVARARIRRDLPDSERERMNSEYDALASRMKELQGQSAPQ
jgi:hypothetical protein